MIRTMKQWMLLCIGSLLLITAVPQHAVIAATCAAETTALETGFTTRTVQSGGRSREYLLYVPANYDAAQPAPLVLSFHGFASNPREQAGMSRWHELAEIENFLVVYPKGTGIPLRWHSGSSPFIGASTEDDVQYVRNVISDLGADACLDPARIFVNGLSNGGGMSNRLACEANDLVAAMGGVAGAYSPVECQITRPVPVIAFHGTSDRIVNYEGSTAQFFPAIQTWAREWAERDGCNLTAEPLAVANSTTVTAIRYGECEAGAEVILYTIEGDGHTWAGGPNIPYLGKTTQDIDATALMWDFFTAHPLP